VLSRAAQKKVREAVWNLEKLGSVTSLMKLLKARRREKMRAVGQASTA